MTGPDLPARPQTPVPQQALDALLAALPRIHQRRERLAVLQRDPAWLDGPTYQ